MKKTRFKRTEIGEIPEDWEVKKIGEVLKIGHGKDYKNLSNGDVPVYGTGGYMTSVNAYLYDGETVCIGRKGTIDKPFYHKGKIWTVDTLFYTYDFKDVVPKYLYYKFCLIDWLSLNEASGVPSLTAKNIADICIPLPPTLEEQTAIAKVLSDVDNVISTLEKLIVKKKNIKQGTMQELLTGKKRLPGFAKSQGYKQTELGEIPEDWEVKRLGEVAKVVGGGTPSTYNEKYWNGNIQWFTPSEITNSEKYVSKSERTITEEGLKNSSATLLPKNAILLTTRASLGNAAILKNIACTNQGFQSLIAKEIIDSEFLYYLIPTFRTEMISLASGSTFLEISAKKLGNIKIKFPPTLEEQTVIAEILSNMDKEIDTLNKKLQKYRAIKTGMMQQLLTGKIRLV